MSVRDALLILLSEEPKHGYQLKAEFDDATGSSWPLNVGQVYTTLQRLERDGLVEPDPATDDADNRIAYRCTEAGAVEGRTWFDSPVQHPIATRDEVSLKVLLAIATGQVRAAEVVGRQREAAMGALQQLTAMKAETDQSQLAWLLHLDRMILLTEAELRWLDTTEGRLEQLPTPQPSMGSPAGKPQGVKK